MCRLRDWSGEGGRSSASNGGVGARGLRPRGRPFERRYRPWFTVCDALRAWLLGASIMSWLSKGDGSDDVRDGMDQHREQITAEWIDTITGEISRTRIAPADRGTVREFLARFDGAGLEVALEATTGWRFVVEELQRVGADAHLAEPAQTSGLKGKKQRAKTDWADARHLRELLLIGRLPESWIAPGAPA